MIIEREVSEEYKQYIRSHPCCTCGAVDVDVHHLKTVGSGGSDYSTVPLCRICHTEWHTIGASKFREKRKVDLWREAFNYFHKWVREQQCR